MSSRLTLARPYARAAFELARSGSVLTQWQNHLRFCALAVKSMHAMVTNPLVEAGQLVQLLMPPEEVLGSTFSGFLEALATNRRLSLLPEILELFEELKRLHEQTLKVTLRTAVPIDAQQAEALKNALKKRFSRDIEMATLIDPEVIGGAVIDAGDIVIDGSVRGRLTQLEHSLSA
jgi:F-type H+-transporting ATPase subunit delta